MIGLLPAIALGGILDVHRVDFFNDLLPKARACTCADCVKKTVPYTYGRSQGETTLATDHAALMGGWDGKTPKMEKMASICVAPDIRIVRFGPLSSPAGSWHYLNSSLISGGVAFEAGERVKAFWGGLVTVDGDPISVPPLHAHHIHIVERANLHQTDFHLWETHGDFSIGKTYGIGDESTKGYQKQLPAPYTAPVHEGAKIWVYSVLNDVRTWVEGAKAEVPDASHRGTPGWGIQDADPSKGVDPQVAMTDVLKEFPELKDNVTLALVKDAISTADSDQDGLLSKAEYTTFLTSIHEMAKVGGSEWVSDAGTDTTPMHKLHGVQPIEFYMEVAFAIEEDASKAIDVVAFDARNPWPCSMEGRMYEATDAFFRVKTPNYPAVMIWTHIMPISGKVLDDTTWTHNHHLRSYAMAQVRGALPNTRETCDYLGVTKDAGTGLPDGVDWHKVDDALESFNAFVSFPGHEVTCKTDPSKATNVAIWTNAADGIKPGTKFDRALQIECISPLEFKKGDHFTNAFFVAPMFEPDIEFIGMHTNFWYFVLPTEDVVTDFTHGIFKPMYDDCASTCGNDAPHFNKDTLSKLDAFDPIFQTIDWAKSAVMDSPSSPPSLAPSSPPLFLDFKLLALGGLVILLAGALAAKQMSKHPYKEVL